MRGWRTLTGLGFITFLLFSSHAMYLKHVIGCCLFINTNGIFGRSNGFYYFVFAQYDLSFFFFFCVMMVICGLSLLKLFDTKMSPHFSLETKAFIPLKQMANSFLHWPSVVIKSSVFLLVFLSSLKRLEIVSLELKFCWDGKLIF